MRIILFAGLAVGCLFGISAPASAGSVNGMQQAYVCDATTNQGANCLKPNSDGSINVSGTISAGGVAQGSTTSGQSGGLSQGATTTAAPTYTTGTTNPLSLDTSGNLRVNVVTGASSGAVSQGSTTSGQTVVPMGCRTLTSAPTDTTAQTNMPWCTTKGSQVVAQPTAADLNATVVGTGTFATQASIASGADVVEGASNDSAACASGSAKTIAGCLAQIHVDATAAIPAGTNIIGKVGIDQTTDGTTNAVHLVAGTAIAGKVGIDQTTPGTTNGVVVNSITAGANVIGKVSIDQTTLGTTNAVQPIPGTSGGLTMFYLTAAASTNATNVKASAGQLYRADLSNNSATPAYVSFYNNSGTPTCGTSIVYQMMIPANSTSGAGWVSAGSMGLSFSSGIGICVTTGIAGTGNVAASAYTISLGYK